MTEKQTQEMTREEANQIYKQSIHNYECSLDLSNPSGILSFTSIPTVMIVLSVLSYLIAKLNLSIFLLLMLLYTVNHFFKRRYDSFKRSFQSMIYEATRRERSRNNWESVEWLNYIIRRVWTVVEPIVSKEVLVAVNNFFYENKPPFLNSIRLNEFTLGSVSPKILGVAHHDGTGDEIVEIDVEVCFIPLETQPKLFSVFMGGDKQHHYNSRVCLSASLGAKNIGIDLPILVENIMFSAKTRIILTLTQTFNVVREVEVMLLEMPTYDFKLTPLRVVDVMDLPGLSAWINGIIRTNLQKNVVNPQSIKLNVEKLTAEQKVVIGVMKLHILEYESRDTRCVTIEIDVDGNRLFTTTEKHGCSLLFNEYFYLCVTNKDDMINFRIKDCDERGNLLIGRVLRNFNFFNREKKEDAKKSKNKKGVECTDKAKPENVDRQINKDDVSIQSTTVTNGIQIYEIKMKTDGIVTSTMRVAVSYFEPIQPEGRGHLTNSAIVKMNVVRIEEMQPINYTKKSYATSCSIFVSPERLEKKKEDIWLISKTSNIIGGLFDFIGGSSKEKLYTSTPVTFFGHMTKTVVDYDSPKFNDECVFYSRSLSNDIIQIMVIDKNKQNAKLTGNLEIPAQGIYDGQSELFRLRDMQKGKIEIRFGLHYINESKIDPVFYYDRVLKLDFIEFSCAFGNGNYSISLFVDGNVINVDPICGDLLMLQRTVAVPMAGNKEIRFDIYKENSREEVYIGTGVIENYKDGINDVIIYNDGTSSRADKTSLNKEIGLESGRLGVKILTYELEQYKGLSDNEDQIKLINCNFTDFSEIPAEFRVELVGMDGLMAIKKWTDCNFSFMTGNCDVKAVFKSNKIGSNKILGDLTIPKRKYSGKVLLHETGFKCNLNVDVMTCKMRYVSNLKLGTLSLRIVSVNELKGKLPNTFVKVHLNNTQKLRTKIIEKTQNPIFNESVSFEINKMHDVLKISVHSFSDGDSSKDYGVIETNLYFLQEGTFINKFQLVQNNSMVKMDTYVLVETVFGKIEEKKKKKNFLNGLLAL